MSRNKYLLQIPLLFFIGWTLQKSGISDLLGIPHAYAADTAAEDFMNMVSYAVGLAITAMNLIMWILFRFLDIVLDPYFIFDLQADGKDGPLLDMLHNIWQ